MLDAEEVLTHPFVIVELALGHLQRRQVVLPSLQSPPRATVALDHEALHFIERHRLAGLGLGYIDAHLLASTQLTAGASFWTRDKRLLRVAQSLGLAKGHAHAQS